jgi:GTP1/Obg family GTP-binding protein
MEPKNPAHRDSSLLSKDDQDLLDIVNNLQPQGIGPFVDLPQIIVCGNQSSGKSSVLARIAFLQEIAML